MNMVFALLYVSKTVKIVAMITLLHLLKIDAIRLKLDTILIGIKR